MNLSRSGVPTLCASLVLSLLAACGGGGYSGTSASGMPGTPGYPGSASGTGPSTPTSGNAYTLRNLVSDGTSTTYADPSLVNGWGIAFNPQGFVWVSDAGTSKSTLYDGNGVPQSLVVDIPAGSVGPAVPTGIVFNGSTDFKVSQAGASGASPFIFVGATGTIAGWSPTVNMTNAIQVFDGGASHDSFTGAALAAQGTSNFLYAADFHNAAVDVFDSHFAPANAAGGFNDPNLPAGYAPFGLQAIGGNIYVSYAMQDAQAARSTSGPGLGIVDEFDSSGTLIKRLITGGALNAPWGMAMAPATFGKFANALLVGNFGDGTINAFDPTSGALLGTLSTAAGTPIVIDGLWGIAFGNDLNSQPSNTLFFAAGPSQEQHGVYGRIDVQ
jgi:uncharacterized protein (TIGR03118 family)